MTDIKVKAPFLEIEMTPNPALVDQNISIRLAGFAPEQLVTLQGKMRDDANQTWRSEASFNGASHQENGASSQH